MFLDAVDDRAHGRLVREDADPAVDLAHAVGEVLADDRRLVAGLEEEIRREEAGRRLLDDHHRVPVVDVGRLEEPQPVAAEVERVAVAEALDPPLRGEAERMQVQRARQLGSDELGARRLVHEALHAPALVAFEVQERHVGEACRVEHLADRLADALVGAACSPVWISAGRSSSIRN